MAAKKQAPKAAAPAPTSASVDEKLDAAAAKEAELERRDLVVAEELAQARAREEAEHREKWFFDLPPGTKGAAKGTGGNTTYHRFLMCKGVEWGFQLSLIHI